MTNITIIGSISDEKYKLMVDHIDQIKSSINKDSIMSIIYYPDDYYSEITIKTDLFDTVNGFNPDKVIEKLTTKLYSCEQKLDENHNPIISDGNAFFIMKRAFNRSVNDQRAELKAKFSDKGLVGISYSEEKSSFNLDFRKDVINGDYNSIITELSKLGYSARFSHVYTADFGAKFPAKWPESVIVLNVDLKK
jgi:hypothetical protein